jgi:hypothetical protein
VLEGLTFVHDLGFAHRNIRPEVTSAPTFEEKGLTMRRR